MAEAWRVNKHEPEPTALSVTLVPTRPRLQSYLVASLFKPSFNNCLPGLPFDRERFWEAETTYRVDFDSVVLGFRSQRGESSHISFLIVCQTCSQSSTLSKTYICD